MKTNLKTWLVVSMFLLAIGSAANAKTIYVDADRPPGGGGTSWADAYKYLQDALADANTSAKPVEIRVAQGTYTPDCNSADPNGSGDRTATFQLINDVNLMGGFAGFGEADPDARDVSLYETILSGDLDGNDVQVPTSDLLTEPTRAENSYHVVTANDVDANSSLDGFTITAGNANGAAYPNNAAGGMDSDNSTVTLLNCTFTANSASGSGGAMSRWDDLDRPTTITNCTFNNNFAASYGGGIFGERMTLTHCTLSGNSAFHYGGLHNKGNGILTNCSFVGNSAEGVAGGMSATWGEQLTLTNCRFVGNSAGYRGGGLGFDYCDESKLTNCAFIGNSAGTNGGGIWNMDGPDNFHTLTNCTFSGNSASVDGGAHYTTHSYPTFNNCTFSRNSAGSDGGAYCVSFNGGDMAFNNCIFWGNTASGEGPQIAIKTPNATVSVDYSDVQGGEPDIYDPYVRLVWGDANNINSDPCFVDAHGADDTVGTEDDDLHLLWDSNCINVGDPSIVFDVNERDIDGEPRVMVGRVDMGADEVGEKQADFTRNGRIDFEDLGVFVQSWLSSPADIEWYILCDLIEDDQIDFKDYADFAADYLWQASWYEP